MTSQNFNLTVVEINVHGDLSTYSMPGESSYCHWLNLADFFFEVAFLIVMNVPLSILVYNEYTNVLMKTRLCLISWNKISDRSCILGLCWIFSCIVPNLSYLHLY